MLVSGEVKNVCQQRWVMYSHCCGGFGASRDVVAHAAERPEAVGRSDDDKRNDNAIYATGLLTVRIDDIVAL